MAKRFRQIISLTIAVFFINGCTTVLPSQASTATVSPTSVALPTISTNALAITAVSPVEEVEVDTNQENLDVKEVNIMIITIGENVLSATLADNSSADALKEALNEGPITINMRDYGNMEKVGSLGMGLPRNDQQITTEAGDIILYQGNAIVIYYAPNSWNFTRLGKINDLTAVELKEILGDGNVTVTLSLPQ